MRSKSTRQYPIYLTEAEKTKRITDDTHHNKLEYASEICGIWAHFFFYAQPQSKGVTTLPLMECWCDAVAGLNFVYHGFYKEALISLRSTLELTLSTIYFTENPAAIQIYETTGETPRWSQLYKIVLSLPAFETYRKYLRKRGWVNLLSEVDPSELNDVYHYRLSQAAHSFIDTWNVTRWRYDIAPTYNRRAFQEWFRYYKIINRLCFLYLLLYFPDVVSFIQTSQMPEDLDFILTPGQKRYFRIAA